MRWRHTMSYTYVKISLFEHNHLPLSGEKYESQPIWSSTQRFKFPKAIRNVSIYHLSNPAMPSSPVCSRRKYGKRDSTAASMLDSSGAAFLMFLHMQDLEGVDIDHLVVRWTTHMKTRRREARRRQGRAGTLLRADIRQTCVPCLFIICSSRASKSQKPGLK